MSTFALVHGAWHAPYLPSDDESASFDDCADVICAALADADGDDPRGADPGSVRRGALRGGGDDQSGDEHGQGADDRGAWAEQVHLLSSWVWPPTAPPAIGN